MTSFWIGVASLDHVRIGVQGGFCQLGHGRRSAVEQLRPGDSIIYYSPRERMDSGAPVQAFTAAGLVLDGEPRPVEKSAGIMHYRRDVRYFTTSEASIRPLLSQLLFTKERQSWGNAFRRGAFRIPLTDYRLILQAMKVWTRSE